MIAEAGILIGYRTRQQQKQSIENPKRTGQLNKRSNEAGEGEAPRRSPAPAGESSELGLLRKG